MKSERRTILFIQLPQTDNDPADMSENPMLAANYLRYAAKRAHESEFFMFSVLPPTVNNMDNANLIQSILKKQPDIICVTLYVWNVERSLRILEPIKKANPRLRVIAGGPEVARNHPFLFKTDIIDTAVIGEGESVFPHILRAIRTNTRTNFTNVAWRKGNNIKYGTNRPPLLPVDKLLPPPHLQESTKNLNPAYIETSRGCPMKCAFCCYNMHRSDFSWIPANNTARRIHHLHKKGIKEFRFIDPTLNANPQFTQLLRLLSRINTKRKLSFFAELRPDTVTAEQARLLHQANFTELELGLQSVNPSVLRSVNRQVNLRRLKHAVNLLGKYPIKLTIDIMCGLPGQTIFDIGSAIKWANKQRHARIQLLHTLLLPGTVLRSQKHQLRLTAQTYPPYRVTKTRSMTENDFARAEIILEKETGCRLDNPTRRFIGSSLPDLFEERIVLQLHKTQKEIPGKHNRRALLIKDNDFFSSMPRLLDVIKTAVINEPDILWQFVLCPVYEEPLDIFDAMIAVLEQMPHHFIDRLRARANKQNQSARRVMVLLSPHRRYNQSWINAVNSLLLARFY